MNKKEKYNTILKDKKKNPFSSKINKPLKEAEKVTILLAQLKIANDKWLYLENQRLYTLELFLSFSGISTILFYANVENIKTIVGTGIGQYIIPLLFYFIGWVFYAIFWYREYYYQLSKEWCKRIEQELQLIYKNEQYRRVEDYDGAYRLYYFGTNFDEEGKGVNDLSSSLHGLSIAIITTLITCLTLFIILEGFSELAMILSCIGCLFIFFLTSKIILKLLNKKFLNNQDKLSPKIRKK